jgi:hypothetical protein
MIALAPCAACDIQAIHVQTCIEPGIDKQGNVLPDSGEETVDTGTDDQGGEGGSGSTDPNE